MHFLHKSKTKFYSCSCIVWLWGGSKAWTIYITLIISLNNWVFRNLITMGSTYYTIIPACLIFVWGSPIFVWLSRMNNTSRYFRSPIPEGSKKKQMIFKTAIISKNNALPLCTYSHHIPIYVIKSHCVSTTRSPSVRASISNVTPRNIDSLSHTD